MKKNLIAVIIGVFVALLGVELILRLQNYQYVPLKLKVFEESSKNHKEDMLIRTDWRTKHEKEEYWHVYSPKLMWQPKRNYRLFNAQGFRGKLVEITKAPNEYRLLAIGDSNTLGPTLGFGWVEYLGQLLEKKIDNIHVINAGVWGYSSWQGLKRLEEMIKYQPDIVLISFGANDVHRVVFSDKEYISSRRFFNIVYYSRLCQLLLHIADIWALKKYSADQLIPRVSLSEYTDNLNVMIDLSEKSKSKVILLTRPNIVYENSRPHPLWWINWASQYNDLTRKIAKEREAEFIDIYSYFKDKEKYFANQSHFNDEGHKIAAKLIYDHIVKDLSE